MTDQKTALEPDWPTCDAPHCIGIRMKGEEACLAHVHPQAREAFVDALKPGLDLDLRGVPIGPDLLTQLLAALRCQDKVPVLGQVQFNRAQLSGDARFDGAQFSGDASFNQAQFSGLAGFDRALFRGEAWVSGAQFSGTTGFHNAYFMKTARFDKALFKRGGLLGPLFALDAVVVDEATFEQAVTVEVLSPNLLCVGTQFSEAVTLRLRYAAIILDGAVFTKPSIIAFDEDALKFRFIGPEVEVFDETPVAWAAGGRPPRPRLLSLRQVDVAGLTLGGLDLSACLFQGAHNLDQVRIEGSRPFADAPAPWRLHLGRWWVPVWWRWSRRQTLAEEHHWRGLKPSPAVPGRWSRLAQPTWHGPACETPILLTKWTRQRPQRLMPDRLAVLYRALRKAQEDSKDEPGAADFYYGEMEMRRVNRGTPWAERVILWLYWLVSGYSLRGLRALAWLGVAVVGLAALLQAIGFNDGDPPFRDAVIYAAQSTVSIPSSNKALTEHVSWAGEALRIALRLIGPLLLGLALLSVRNRVKR